MLDIQIKNFSELTTKELYDILQLRSEVFVVEQDCVYQDMDGKDTVALHVMGFKDTILVAYARLFQAGHYFNETSIGRVVVKKNERHQKDGHDIMLASIDVLKQQFNASVIKISAQCYLKKFYNSLGFKETGNTYLEDGIPHIAMIKN